jgi:hypothetical protein
MNANDKSKKESQWNRFVLASLALFFLLCAGCLVVYSLAIKKLNSLQLDFRKPVIQAQTKR